MQVVSNEGKSRHILFKNGLVTSEQMNGRANVRLITRNTCMLLVEQRSSMVLRTSLPYPYSASRDTLFSSGADAFRIGTPRTKSSGVVQPVQGVLRTSSR